MPTKVAVHVVKVGGSLLTRGDFVTALQEWVKRQLEGAAPSHLILLVGGGPLVDSLREIDRLRSLDQEFSHWTAIELMDLSGRIVAGWLPEWSVESSLDGLRGRLDRPGVTLFLASEFLRHEEPMLVGVPLPVGWHVTSDSIAARLAEVLAAERLTLLKSEVPPAGPWEGWGAAGYVDQHFAAAAARLRQVSAEVVPAADGEQAP